MNNYIVPEVIRHRIEESETIEIQTKLGNFNIKIKAHSVVRLKQISDELVATFSLIGVEKPMTHDDRSEDVDAGKVTIRPGAA